MRGFVPISAGAGTMDAAVGQMPIAASRCRRAAAGSPVCRAGWNTGGRSGDVASCDPDVAKCDSGVTRKAHLPIKCRMIERSDRNFTLTNQ